MTCRTGFVVAFSCKGRGVCPSCNGGCHARCRHPRICPPAARRRLLLIDREVPSYFRSLEHLLRYCARPPFALDRLSVNRDTSGRIARIRYVLPRHKAANWVGPGRGRKSTRPGANGVVELTPFEFLDRLADEPPPLLPARGPPTDCSEFVQAHDDRAIFQASPDELPVFDIHSL